MSKDNRKRPPLLIREQFEGILNRLTDAERGILVSALMAYKWHDTQPQLPDRLAGIFDALQSFIDDDDAKYLEKCNKNRQSIQNHWDNRRNQE